MDIDKISRKEEKIKLGKKIAERVKDGQTIGFGSGSTSYLTAIEIGKKVEKEHLHIIAIPTSKEIENVCKQYKIQIGNLVENKIDWAFDGADEVDPDNNMIKGMGAAMFKEKLNILNSPINYILIDQTKFVKELGEKHPVPVEVFPQALEYVSRKLEELGATETIFRGMTENQNAILDVRFEKIDNKLEAKIKNITGVIESGLFMGYNVEIISL
ncbi:ribose 5-phosphate isomerase A [Clostridium sp. CAG:793]|jgi:ribose 5-phosphate isomerase A|nr:ribose 5-phosphate isomerase A [Clostridium sp. CAG:793]